VEVGVVFLKHSNNKLFVAYKPPFVSSNLFLSRLKRKYSVKKAGFSGTLDPLAKGVLLIAFNQYTKLFQFLDTCPKTYRATLFLGAKSLAFDTENITEVQEIKKLPIKQVENVINNLVYTTHQTPPNFSAKWVDGIRAYELARKGKEFKMKQIPIKIYSSKLLNYSHPFVSFEVVVSKGTYIRSIANEIAKKLGTFGSLSMLERVKEGSFFYENEKSLDPYMFINLNENFYLGDKENILKGKKLNYKDFKIQQDGVYKIKTNNFISIIKIKENKPSYLLNQIYS